jgi:hypothetical protein
VAATQNAPYAGLDLDPSSRERELPEHERTNQIHRLPPYPGLIDDHERHRFAYELLGLADLREREAAALARRAPVVGVANERHGLTPGLLDRAGLRRELRYNCHVCRRAGRRAGEYFDDVLVARCG